MTVTKTISTIFGIFFLLAVYAQDVDAACTSPNGVEGQVQYRQDYRVLTYCNGTSWIGVYPGGSGGSGSGCIGPASCPNIGNICADSTVFVGCSLTDYKLLFTTRCDPGQTLSGSTCTGSTTLKPWNNGNTSGFTTTGATSETNGVSNSAAILATDADSGTAGIQPHQAAAYCHSLNINGNTDFYLPSLADLYIIFFSKNSVPGLDLTGGSGYWTSTEYDMSSAEWMEFLDGDSFYDDKSNPNYSFRCVRKQ